MPNNEEKNPKTLDQETDKRGKAAVDTAKNTAKFAGKQVKNTASAVKNTAGLGASILSGNVLGAVQKTGAIAKDAGNAVKDTGNFIGNQTKTVKNTLENGNKGGEPNNQNTLDNSTDKMGKAAVDTAKNTAKFAGKQLKNTASAIKNTAGLGASILTGNALGAIQKTGAIAKDAGNTVKDTAQFVGEQAKTAKNAMGDENSRAPQGNRKMDRNLFRLDSLNKLSGLNEISKLQQRDGTLNKARQAAKRNQKKMADLIKQRHMIKIKMAIISGAVVIGIGILIIGFIGSLLYAHDDQVVEKSSESIGSRDISQDVEIVTNEDGTSSYEIKAEVYEDFAAAVESEDINLDTIAVTYGDGTVDENGVLDREDQLEELMDEIDKAKEEEQQQDETSTDTEENGEGSEPQEDAKLTTNKEDTLKLKKELFDLQNSSKAIMSSIELASTDEAGTTTDSDDSDDTDTEAKTSMDADEASDYQVYSRYLEKMVEAYMYTTLPNLGGDQPNSGMVKVIRRSYKAEDTDRYEDDETPNPDKEIQLSYMKKEEFDEKLEKLEKKYNEKDYNELRNYFTISFDAGTTTSGDAGTGTSSGDIVYDISLAGATKSPSEFGVTTTKISDVRTTVYTSSAEENGRIRWTNIFWN